MSDIKEKTCSVLLEDGVCLRKCFMTGEFCSKQGNIQRVRNRLHKQKEINAFVVMNFSNMSDVVYKWKIQQFIQSLSRYLYIKERKLFCSNCDIDSLTEENEILEENRIKINVLRSDTEPANNYVVCNRICQQLQIADLIIVDVSSQNPNVFYELGMAIAMQKLVLPICYSESYYKMVLPAQTQKILDDNKCKQGEKQEDLEELEHHIDCFTWRRRLFEYYGIIFRHQGGMRKTIYLEFEKAKILNTVFRI